MSNHIFMIDNFWKNFTIFLFFYETVNNATDTDNDSDDDDLHQPISNEDGVMKASASSNGSFSSFCKKQFSLLFLTIITLWLIPSSWTQSIFSLPPSVDMQHSNSTETEFMIQQLQLKKSRIDELELEINRMQNSVLEITVVFTKSNFVLSHQNHQPMW